jgi:hypothetical protein
VPSMALGGHEAGRGSGWSPQGRLAPLLVLISRSSTLPAALPSSRCDAGSFVWEGHHLLYRFHLGLLGLDRRVVLRSDPSPSAAEATVRLGIEERPLPMIANIASRGRAATACVADVAGPMWPPAFDPVAAVAQPPMRRSPRRRPHRAAPDQPGPRQGTRALPPPRIPG